MGQLLDSSATSEAIRRKGARKVDRRSARANNYLEQITLTRLVPHPTHRVNQNLRSKRRVMPFPAIESIMQRNFTLAYGDDQYD